MRMVVQRSLAASVSVEGETTGSIESGLVVLLAVATADGEREVDWAADKIANLRIFQDEDGRMNRSLLEAGGEALVVSQFTLYGDVRKGRRPSFVGAAGGAEAEELYLGVVKALEALGIPCATGRFGADMKVALVGDGPVTILLDSDRTF